MEKQLYVKVQLGLALVDSETQTLTALYLGPYGHDETVPVQL
jgi:hypothetical protein